MTIYSQQDEGGLAERLEHSPLYSPHEREGDLWCECSCGARWSHPASHDEVKRKEIFDAHVAYFNRPKMETL